MVQAILHSFHSPKSLEHKEGCHGVKNSTYLLAVAGEDIPVNEDPEAGWLNIRTYLISRKSSESLQVGTLEMIFKH